jgi:AraC-like DNA-binding protein
MDNLSAVLDSLRLRSMLYCQSTLLVPWALRFAKTTTAVFHVMEQGCAWLTLDDGASPVAIGRGDLVVLPQGTGHHIGHAPDEQPLREIYLDREMLDEPLRKVQSGVGEKIVLICGLIYTELPCQALFATLPALLHFSAAQTQALGIAPLLGLLTQEMNNAHTGSQTIARRLIDMLLIQVLRACLQDARLNQSGWLAALRDPQIGKALALMHSQPAYDWSVEALASQVALARSTFTARFTEWLGQPPAEYLTAWRMQLAADLLRHTSHSVAEVSTRVGYASEAAFSKAFKREMGLAPRHFRK